MNKQTQEINRLKLLLILSLMSKENQEETNNITQLLLLCIEAIANDYEKRDKYDLNNSNDDINNRNLCPSVLICENPCNDNAGNRFIKKTDKELTVYLRHGQIAVAMDIEVKFDSTSDYGSINRYMLSGDLLAGKITKTIKLDNSTVTKKEWYHLDHLNSTKATTDELGKMSTMYEYRAFGEELKKLGSGDAKYTYGGKELDDETNLYYFNARYYDATIGRFINVDPVQDGLNWYVYCNNNPLSFKDPTGLDDYGLFFDPIRSIVGSIISLFNNTKPNVQQATTTTTSTSTTVAHETITQGFDSNSYRSDWYHKGLDIVNDSNAVYARKPGEVTYSGESPMGDNGVGNLIIVKNTDGTVSMYGHTKESTKTVESGSLVTEGQYMSDYTQIGQSTGSHLHYQENNVPDDFDASDSDNIESLEQKGYSTARGEVNWSGGIKSKEP